MGAKFCCVDRRTDMMKLIVTFCSSVNTPNKEYVQHVSCGYNMLNIL